MQILISIQKATIASVGTVDTVVVVVADVATRPHVVRIAGVARVRRHLFNSSDIRIKAFTFNQN